MAAVTAPEVGVEIVRLLLEHGADANAVEGQGGYSVLALAIQGGDVDKVRLLLESEADIHYGRECGYDGLIDALHSRAVTDKEPLLPLIELLQAHGAPTRGESDYGESALSVSSRIGRFDVVARLLEAGANAELLEWNELMHAVALGSVQEVARLLEAKAASEAGLTSRDRWERTPWLLSLHTGEIEKARLLLEAGAHLDEVGNCGQTALMHAIENEQVEMLSWLLAQGAEVDARDEFGNTALMMAAEQGATECVRCLLEGGATPGLTDGTPEAAEKTRASMEEFLEDMYPVLQDEVDEGMLDFSSLPGQSAIMKAANLDIVRLLVAAGEDLNDISDEMRAELTGLETEGDIECSLEEYAQEKHRRFGTANPERMDIAFWKAMVRSGATAYAARVAFHDTGDDHDSDSLEDPEEPVWCFHRFGKSITELPDGRIIEIGGEHEDSYDPDFCIYNEVFVHHGSGPHGGGQFDILGYPEDVFPPTDFHSATLVGDAIYIIGCLGYPEERRPGATPVYRLDCATLAIEKVETSGEPPGWISRHKARYQDGTIVLRGGQVCVMEDGEEELIENHHEYMLDLALMKWRLVR